MDEPETTDTPGEALTEFEAGFRDGYRGNGRDVGRTGTYRASYARGRDAATR